MNLSFLKGEKMSILLTGGTGYIGSNTAVALINAGYDIVIADNLYNSSKEVLRDIEKLSGKMPKFYEIDVLGNQLADVFEENKIDAVVHFAGYKAVGESCEKPLMYYENNLGTTINLLKLMDKYGCKKIIFSSSATVYGPDCTAPYTEDQKTGSCSNPYGWTKYMNEQIIRDTANASPGMSAVLLRYFNPIGANKNGLLGEKPNGIPNNLLPYIVQVAHGQREHLNVFGDDYDTPDGTCIRDYIHVMDLADGHKAALDYMMDHNGVLEVNLGTGKGTSVLEMIEYYEKANDLKIPYVIAPRRAGDLPVGYAKADKAEKLLKWHAVHSIEEACKDAHEAGK